MKLWIEKINNGYTASDPIMGVYAFKTTEELFQYLLSKLEGKSEYFNGDYYGKVSVVYNKDAT